MNSARRSLRRRDWPRGLYEPRPGYYTWRHPDGRSFALGAIPFAHARHQAIQANAHIQQSAPSLVDRLSGSANTIAQLLEKMPAATKTNTIKNNRSLDKSISEALGKVSCLELTTRHCAEWIEGVRQSGLERQAQALRSRLIAVCRRGQELGWMDHNPAEATSNPSVAVKRGRLTLEMFRAVYDAAPQVSEWLQTAMALAIVTGADRVTVASLTRADVTSDTLVIKRSKTADTTGLRIAIPLDLRLDVLGWTLRDLTKRRTAVVTRHLVHHVKTWGNAPPGSPVHPDRISRAFTDARRLAKIPDELPDGKLAPTFHEIRSLAKRLYLAQGNVDTKALLGHSTERAADIYANPRGAEAVLVRVS